MILRNLLIAVALVLLCGPTGGCEARDPLEPTFPEDGLRLAFLPPVTPTPEWEFVVAGARRYISTRGQIQIREISSDAYQADLEGALGIGTDRQPHAVVLGVWHGPRARPVAEALLHSGIPVLTYGNRVPIEGIYGHVQVQRLDGAEALARALPEIVAPRRSYVLVHNRSDSAFDEEIYHRFRGTASKAFSVTQLAAADAYERDLPPLQVAEQLLQEYPHAGLIVSLTNRSWTETPYERIQQLPCRVALLTAVPSTWRWVRFGQAPAVVGGLDGLGGHKVAALAIAAATRSRNAPLFDVLPTELVTVDNLDDFIERYSAAIGAAPGPLAETGHLSAP